MEILERKADGVAPPAVAPGFREAEYFLVTPYDFAALRANEAGNGV